MKSILRVLGGAALTLSLFIFSSCDQLEELAKFDFDLEGEAIDITVGPLEVGEEVVIGSEQFEKSLNDIIKEHAPNANLSKIKEIKLTKISLQIVSGADDNNNFENLSSIYTNVNATGMGETGLLVAKKSDIPEEYAVQLDVPVEGGGINVLDYFNKTNFEYIIRANVRKATTKDLTLRIKADYSFVFKL